VSWRYESKRRTTLIGEGSLESIAGELKSLGAQRAILVSTRRASASAVASVVRELLGESLVAEFAAVRPHVPIADVDAVVELARRSDADCIVALGGGSVSDAAKAVALCLGGVAASELSGMHGDVGALIPIVAVPTTLSGAETTMGGMFSAEGHKRGFGANGLQPGLIIHDSRQLAEVPPEILTSTGMNALAHCLEALVVRAANPITDAIALEGTEKLGLGLVQLAHGDTSSDVLTRLQIGAALGGICLDTSMVGVHHALCHALGSTFGISHGESNSVILPKALAYNLPSSETAQRRAADRLGPVLHGLGVSEAHDLPTQVADLQLAIGVPRTLSELGVDRAGLGAVADETYTEVVTYQQNPRTPASADELLAILQEAFD
jgi:alcohol dehydrogenase class IV